MLLATLVGIAIALLVGVAGVVFGVLGQRTAKKANDLAAQANRHAETAIAKAEEANRIAEAANKLSQDANTIAQLQAAKEAEDHFVEWAVEWDAVGAALTITNDGRDTAVDPAVIVHGLILGDARQWSESVPRGGQLTVEFPEVIEHRKTFPDDVVGYWWDSLEVVIRWQTPLGQPREQRVHLRVS